MIQDAPSFSVNARRSLLALTVFTACSAELVLARLEAGVVRWGLVGRQYLSGWLQLRRRVFEIVRHNANLQVITQCALEVAQSNYTINTKNLDRWQDVPRLPCPDSQGVVVALAHRNVFLRCYAQKRLKPCSPAVFA